MVAAASRDSPGRGNFDGTDDDTRSRPDSEKIPETAAGFTTDCGMTVPHAVAVRSALPESADFREAVCFGTGNFSAGSDDASETEDSKYLKPITFSPQSPVGSNISHPCT